MIELCCAKKRAYATKEERFAQQHALFYLEISLSVF